MAQYNGMQQTKDISGAREQAVRWHFGAALVHAADMDRQLEIPIGKYTRRCAYPLD